jgi:ligand-binding SRPBCC domain-containing protein
MTRVTVTTDLDAPAAQVWAAVQSPATLLHLTRGLLGFSLDEGAGTWTVGQTVTPRLYLFGVMPVWRHRLTVADVDHQRMRLRSEESGGPVRTWNHHITVTPLDVDRCRYTDAIDIDAGMLTAPVRMFAHLFYRVRQRRWRRLAPVLAGVTSASPVETAVTGDVSANGPTAVEGQRR